jgi:hypothetical protein
MKSFKKQKVPDEWHAENKVFFNLKLCSNTYHYILHPFIFFIVFFMRLFGGFNHGSMGVRVSTWYVLRKGISKHETSSQFSSLQALHSAAELIHSLHPCCGLLEQGQPIGASIQVKFSYITCKFHMDCIGAG